ncbi:MAG: hypothetical protein IJT43_09990 [Stomatobaculum sp.]|nr:hypothetical protein [Stomatobaculum sp.]
MKRIIAMLAAMVLLVSLCLTGCGGAKDSGANGAPDRSIPGQAAEQTTEAPDPNLGVYYVEGMMGMTAEELAPMMGSGTADDFRKSFVIELKEDGKGTVSEDGDDPAEMFWKLDGDKLTLAEKENPSAEDEVLEGTLADGVLVISAEGVEMVFAKEGTKEKAQERIKASSEDNPLAALLGEINELESESAEAETEKAAESAADAETTEAAAAETTTAAETTAAAETTKAAAETAKAAAAAAAGQSSDLGKYMIYEYEAGGQKVTYDILKVAGMGDTYLELKDGGEAELYLFNQKVDVTWEPGVVIAYGTSRWPYTIDGDTLTLDMAGVTYVMKRDGSAPAGGSSAAATTAAETTAAETKAAETTAAETKAAVSADVPQGDGLISGEEVQKGYVWLSKVAKDPFNMTYKDLAEHFGVDGEFDKEEYSDHMKRNKRYYKWISKENPNLFIYVNFDEKDAANKPGVYTISGYNSSGFTASEAESKYLDIVKAEASEADKAAAANAAMKDFSVDIHPWGNKEDFVTVSMEVPESGWAYDEKKDHLVENENVNTFGAGFIQFKLEKNVEKFDFYKDKFENYKDIDDREFGGVTFKGRTYKNIGYNWTEYIAQLDDDHAMSIGIVRVDINEGTMGDKILNSISFK